MTSVARDGSTKISTKHEISTTAEPAGYARDLGFEIGDIRELLTLRKRPDRSCDEVDVITRRHLSDVDRRIAQLSALRTELLKMVDQCGGGRVSECRVIEAPSATGGAEHS